MAWWLWALAGTSTIRHRVLSHHQWVSEDRNPRQLHLDAGAGSPGCSAELPVVPVRHRNGQMQSDVCSVAEMIKAALLLILSPVPDFLSSLYKLLFAGEPSLSCYHLGAWHEHKCCRQKLPKNWHQICRFASLYCASIPLMSRRVQGLRGAVRSSVFSTPDTSAGLFLYGWFSPNMALFSLLEFFFALIPFDFPPSDKHFKQRIVQ